jgi:predicted Rdx family selenoprotein
MYPLIEIKSVPIELEFKTTNAKLEYSKGTAELEISRDNGGLSIHSRAIRLNLDTFESRNSISPTTARATLQSAQQGRQAAYEATATYAQQGQLLLNAKIGQELVTQFAADAQTKDLKTNVGLQFLPTVGPDISWEPAEMNIRYEMDKLNFDWRVNQAELEFIPGDIEISVKQQPDVIIKYVGGPLYVPPSSDPDYEPVDVEA